MTMVDVEGGAGNDVGRDRLRGEKEEKENARWGIYGDFTSYGLIAGDFLLPCARLAIIASQKEELLYAYCWTERAALCLCRKVETCALLPLSHASRCTLMAKAVIIYFSPKYMPSPQIANGACNTSVLLLRTEGLYF